jgi:hypothetical protein
MVILCFPKKICHLRIKIDLGEKYYLQCKLIGANGKAFTLQVYYCLNFPGLLGFLKIICNLMSGRSRRIAAAIWGTVLPPNILGVPNFFEPFCTFLVHKTILWFSA